MPINRAWHNGRKIELQVLAQFQKANEGIFLKNNDCFLFYKSFRSFIFWNPAYF